MLCATEKRIDGLADLISRLPGEHGEKAKDLATFFSNRRSTGIYCLAAKHEIDVENIALALGMNGSISPEFVSYSQICDSIRVRSKRDSSVRTALMRDDRLHTKAVDLFPSISLPHSGMRIWPEICICMQGIFVTETEVLCCREGKIAYYWYDALKVFANYLDLLFASAQGKDVEELAQKCERVITDVLPYCVPLGWLPSGSIQKFLFLCK